MGTATVLADLGVTRQCPQLSPIISAAPEELCDIQNWCLLSEIWAQVFLPIAGSDTCATCIILGFGFGFFPACSASGVLFSPCFFLDPLHDNEQWWTWSPQNHYLNRNGGVSHPQVLLTDSGFQRGLLFLEKQAPFFREGKRGFVQEVSFWREKTHPEPDTAEVSASVPPQWENAPEWLPKSVNFGFVVVCAPHFIISSNVRSRKSIVLSPKLPNVAFLGSAISDLNHCKFHKGSEAPVS